MRRRIKLLITMHIHTRKKNLIAGILSSDQKSSTSSREVRLVHSTSIRVQQRRDNYKSKVRSSTTIVIFQFIFVFYHGSHQ